ncbi:zinc finger CCCH-type with G patch domain-containing protein [Eurosta solidaginis]|uniref:zinc finger CCCH-type with G patch domain-containing protein n=1 Tax=Eurosta solidaginis TaxID=178769 RepID=UPI003530BA27
MDSNIKEYEVQLQSVEQSLQCTKNPEDRTALQSLKSDLLELIALTKQTDEANHLNPNEEYSINEELERFQNEISQLYSDGLEESNGKISDGQQLAELKLKLEKMVGHKCSAPHQHTWGVRSYHNAIVCGIEEMGSLDRNSTLKARLRVLFTNPTHREMLPCSFYLEGDCRFDDAQCHYSHGELIDAEELGPYSEPDFTRLARNCIVLAKLPDHLWHRGRVLCANFVEKQCRVRLDSNDKRERDFAFEDLLPIFNDDDFSSVSSSESYDDEDMETCDETINARQAQFTGNNLFELKLTQPLGDWEKHTRGIGSKLMAKMGYVNGRGLGLDGSGIVIPVSAQVLPQGCSLDRCMELREAANGDKDFFSVEKKLRLQQKKQENLNAKAYERESQKTDVFSFLNENVLVRCAEMKDSKKTTSLSGESTKSLNVASVRIADDIRRKEREISKLKQSIGRNTSSLDVHKRLQQQIHIKTEELKAMQKEENDLSKEQASRKTKDKLFVF